MKKFLVFIVLLSTLASLSPAIAQDTVSYDIACDLPTIQNNINLFIGELGKLKASTETDPVIFADKLQQLANDANMLRAACDNFVFSGTGTKLLGPIQFPAGIYRATMTTLSPGYVGASLTVAQGTCGVGNIMSTLLFNSAGSEAKNGIESLFISDGCTLLIQLDLDASQWDIKFERVTTS